MFCLSFSTRAVLSPTGLSLALCYNSSKVSSSTTFRKVAWAGTILIWKYLSDLEFEKVPLTDVTSRTLTRHLGHRATSQAGLSKAWDTRHSLNEETGEDRAWTPVWDWWKQIIHFHVKETAPAETWFPTTKFGEWRSGERGWNRTSTRHRQVKQWAWRKERRETKI